MKHIRKRPEPEVFTAWKERAGKDWRPTYDTLSGKPKDALKQALMAEQGEICCYCEVRLTTNNSHIEHFRPQQTFPDHALEYRNLHGSCQNQLSKGEPRHCGNQKSDWFDADLLISPLDQTCEKRFRFNERGEIEPASSDDKAAAMTIEKLGLNINKLVNMRFEALDPFNDDALTPEVFDRFVAGYLTPDSAGRFSEFWTMIQHLYGGEPADG